MLLLPYVHKAYGPDRALTWTPQLVSWTPLPAAPSAALPPGLAAQSHWSSGCSLSGLQDLFLHPAEKERKKKKHIQKGLLPPKLFTVQENQQLRLSVSLFSQNLQSQDSLQQKMEKKHESWPTGAQCEEISHIHSSNNPNTICFCPLIYKLAFKRGGEIKLCLPQMDLSVDSLGKGRKHRPRERTAVIRDVLCLLSRK